MSCLSGLKRESCESSDIEMSKWSLFVFWGRDLNERFVGKALLLNLGKATFRLMRCAVAVLDQHRACSPSKIAIVFRVSILNDFRILDGTRPPAALPLVRK